MPSDTKPAIDADLLERTAFALYSDLTKGSMRGYTPEAAALEAFARAKPFCQVAQDIRAGKAIPDSKIADDKPVVVMVHIWDENDKPVMDEQTGKPVLRQEVGDRYAFAPNLPKDHPINQRHFKALEAASNN